MMRDEKSAKKMRLDPDVLDDVVRRVVAVAKPEKIILFGSAAAGGVPGGTDCNAAARPLSSAQARRNERRAVAVGDRAAGGARDRRQALSRTQANA
jgi:hypothetical protein